MALKISSAAYCVVLSGVCRHACTRLVHIPVVSLLARFFLLLFACLKSGGKRNFDSRCTDVALIHQRSILTFA